MIVEALGLEASASTWLYNIIRSIVRTKFPRTYAIESTNLAPIQKIVEVDGRFLHQFPIPDMDEPDAIVIKGHNCDTELFWFLRAARAHFVLSTRDPRDAIASMMTRLGENEQAWAADIVRSLAAIFTARHATRNLLFSYEDRFFEKPETLDEIASFLEVDLSTSERSNIFGDFTREKIATFLKSMDTLPDDRKNVDHAGRLSDRETMFNRTHLGDASSGKWKGVVRSQLHDQIDRCFGGLAGSKQLKAGTTIRFSEALFSPVELGNLQPYEPQHRGGQIRLLRFCWLPRGLWRLNVRGGLPPTNGLKLEISQRGAPLFKSDVDKREMGSIHLSFEFNQRNYADPLFLSVTSYDAGRLDPVRRNAIELEAEFPPLSLVR